MELRDYWTVIRRRWWVPIALVVIVAFAWVARNQPWVPRPPSYGISLSFSVGIRPQDAVDSEENYYVALASEYLIDDLSEVVRGSEFAAAVSDRLADQGLSIPAGAIVGIAQTGDLHRILHISLNWGDPEQLAAIADAIVVTLQEDVGRFMPRLFAQNGAAYLVNRGNVTPLGKSVAQKLDLPIRLLLALVVGIAICFLLHYLDTRVRESVDLEEMGLAVLGQIPKNH
jgi:capsular polysaccharide biosynthesis protein